MDVTIVFFGMSVVTAFLAMVIIAISVSYYKLSKDAHREREELIKIRQFQANKQEEIFAQANVQAQAILVEAQKKAEQMVQSSEIFSKDYSQQLKARLMEITSGISETAKQQLAKEMEMLRSTVKEEYSKSIEDYKRAKYKQIDQEISKTVQDISMKVLKESISEEEHKRLILEALNEARKQNVL